MNKYFSIVALSVICAASMSFVVNVRNIPEELTGNSMLLTSKLDGRMLDSVAITGSSVQLTGNLDTTQWCYIGYTQSVPDGVRTQFKTIFLNNDTVDVVIKNCETGEMDVVGGLLNEKLAESDRYLKSLLPWTQEKFQQFLDYAVDQAYENASNPYGAFMTFFMHSGVTPLEWMKLYDSLSPAMKEYQPVREAYNRVSGMMASQEGGKFIDIKGESIDGSAASLSDYIGKGKYVLADFWATWCGPCRAEAKQTLIPLYDKYKDNDHFMILGIMTSDSADSHREGIKNVNYPWTQFIDTDNVASETYGFTGIPFIVLFGPDGTILRRGIRGEEIWKAVEEALGE